jgi:8-oxo-dGTP diphosphatase
VRKLDTMSPHRDEIGKSISDYVHPSVTVDTAVLTVDHGQLLVALVHNDDSGLRLPGTFLREGETLADAVRRSLLEKLQITGLSPKQLHVFDTLGRDPRGWVLSVAHITVVPREKLGDVYLTPVEAARDLAFDHDTMLALAITELRAEYAEHPDPWHLLERFTLRELRMLHDAIDPDTLMRDSFRRLMEPQLIDTGVMTSGSVGKPSRVFRRATAAERLRADFARATRPARTPRAATRGSSTPGYAVELSWTSGEVYLHTNLTAAEARKIFSGFIAKLTEAHAEFNTDDAPQGICLVEPEEGTVEEHLF